MVFGTVKSWKDRFGFLVSEEVAGDIFVHARENPHLSGPLSPGEQLVFELTPGKDGQAHAVNVQRQGAPPPPPRPPFPQLVQTSPMASAAPMEADGPSMRGRLASFRDGWGLIECESLPEKLWCGIRDNPQITELGMLPGDEVAFEVGTNASNGKSKAVNICFVVKEQSELLGQRVTGSVKSFRDGWGFATSPKFSGSVMLGKKNIVASGLGWLQVGVPVEFEVATGAAGKYEAVNISSSASGGPAPPQFGGSAYASHAAHGGAYPSFGNSHGYGGGAAYSGMSPAIVGPAFGGAYAVTPAGGAYAGSAGARDRSRTPMSGGGGAKRMIGSVKTFRDGWGFVISDQHQGDIYVSAKSNPGIDAPLQKGEMVEFELDHRLVDNKNNGACAINLTRMHGGGYGAPSPPPARSYMAQTPPPPPMVPKGFGKGHMAAGSGPYPGQEVSGVMVTVKDGWGWAQTPSVDGDVFLGMRDNAHLSALPNVGDELTFALNLDPKSGRYKAVSVAHSVHVSGVHVPSSRVQGSVVSQRDGGSWGFASTEGVEGTVMLGKRNLSLAGIVSLNVGDLLQFDLNAAAKGYEAVNIQRV